MMRKILVVLIASAILSRAQTPYNIGPIVGPVPFGSGQVEANSILVGSSATPFLVALDAQFRVKASDNIHIIPNSIASGLSNNALNSHIHDGFFHCVIDTNLLNVVSFYPTGWQNIKRFDRFEIGISLPLLIDQQIESFLTNPALTTINPYDYNQIELEAKFEYYGTSGSSSSPIFTENRQGFYYREITINPNPGPSTTDWFESKSNFPYRVRYAPPMNGNYSVSLRLKLNGVEVGAVNKYFFNVIESGKRGFLKLVNGHFQDANDNPFFAIGQNIARTSFANINSHPFEFDDQRNYIKNLADNNGNFFRVRCDPYSNDIEWEELGVYGSSRQPGENFKRQWHAFELDKTFSLAENRGLYMYWVLLTDFAFHLTAVPASEGNWSNNPYHLFRGLNLPEDFFLTTDLQTLGKYKNKLRYYMARYGYSSNVALISLINEADLLNHYSDGTLQQKLITRQRVGGWLTEMGSFLKNNFNPIPLLTSGYATGPSFPDNGVGNDSNFDIVTRNHYSDSKSTIRERLEEYPKNVTVGNNKPFIYGEIGGDVCDGGIGLNLHHEWYTDADVHNNMWGTVMNSRALGTGLYWWDWEDGYGINHKQNFKALNNFFTNSPPQYNVNSFTSSWACDALLAKNRKIEWIMNVNSSGTKGYGWQKNADYYWVNDPNLSSALDPYITNCYTNPPCNSLGTIGRDCGEKKGPYSYGQHNRWTELMGYQGLKDFVVELWDTYGNGGIYNTFSKTSNILGKIKFKENVGPFPGSPNGNPDFAFKVYRDDASFRTSSCIDTTYVTLNNNCIKAFGYQEGALTGSHSWQVDDRIAIEEENPILCFSQPKVYQIKHTYKDTSLKLITLTQQIQILFDETTYFENEILSEVIIYPNPSTGKFVIKSKDEILSYQIMNNVGQIVSSRTNLYKHELISDELINFYSGIYQIVVSFTGNTKVKTFKMIKE